METKKVVVTGGTGFLGRYFLNKLLQLRYQVVALVRKSSNQSLIPQGVEIFVVDLDSEESIKESLKDAFVVVHLAAEMDFFPKDPGYVYRANVQGTQHLLSACISAGVKRFIYISSTEAMGMSPPGRPATEEDECKPQYDYGKSKVMAEKLVREMYSSEGREYIILRPTGVFGKGDRYASYEMLKAAEWGILFFIAGAGDRFLMFTHVEDVVEGMTKALQSDKPEQVNQTYILCPDEPLSNGDWFRVMNKSFDRIQPFVHIPYSLCEIALGILDPIFNFGKKKSFLFHSEKALRMQEDRWYSNQKAKKLLGYQPKYSIPDGLKKTIDDEVRAGEMQRHFISPVAQGLILTAVLLLAVFRFLFA